MTAASVASFFAYAPSFTGGVRVAAGDVNGDGAMDIVTGAGPGGNAHVKAFDAVFDAVSGIALRSFFAYAPGFTGGVRVAAGDVNGDGFADIVTGPGMGALPHVKVFDGVAGQERLSFLAALSSAGGGVYVAAAGSVLRGPGEQLTNVHELIDGFGLGRGLAAHLHEKVADVEEALRAGEDACAPLNQLLRAVLVKAGPDGNLLPFADARLLLDATNRIALALECISADSSLPAVQRSVLGLLETVDGLDLGKGEANALATKARRAGIAAVQGDACPILADLAEKIAADTDRGKLTAAQGATLAGAVEAIQAEAGCA